MDIKRKFNSTYVLLILLIILATGYWGWQYWQKKSADQGEKLLFAKVDPNQISKIELNYKTDGQDQNVVLEVKDKMWLVTSEKSLPAEMKAVNDILTSLDKIKIMELVSANPGKQADYQVDASGIQVKIYQGDQLLRDFYAGKTGPGYTTGYYRQEGSNQVYLVSQDLSYLFGPASWVNSQITGINDQAITKISWQYPGSTLTLEKKDNLWKINGQEAKTEAVNGFLSLIGNLTAQTVKAADKSMPVKGDLIITVDAGSITKLYLNKDADVYIVRKEGDQREFTIGEYIYNRLAIKLADLK